MFPEGEFSSITFQSKLHNEHRMLCQNHFLPGDFTDDSLKTLRRSAVPHDVSKYCKTNDIKQKNITVKFLCYQKLILWNLVLIRSSFFFLGVFYLYEAGADRSLLFHKTTCTSSLLTRFFSLYILFYCYFVPGWTPFAYLPCRTPGWFFTDGTARC